MAKSEVAIGVALIALLLGASSVLFYHEPGPANVSCNQANYVNTIGNPSVCAQLPPVGPYNYNINHTGSNYNVYDMEGLLVKQSTDFDTVLNFTVASSGVKVFIAAGSYVMAHHSYPSTNNIALVGAGSATNISLSASFGSTPIDIVGSNWIIDSIRFDFRNIATGHSYASVEVDGDNNTISNSFFNGGDHGQINIRGLNNNVIGNVVTNSNDDGIIIQDFSASVSAENDKIIGNTIHKTTNRNCISLVGPTEGILVSANTCVGAGQYGYAAENLGSGANVLDTFSYNFVSIAAGTGNNAFEIYPQSGGVDSCDYCTFIGNVINGSKANSNGFVLASGSNNVFSGNAIYNVRRCFYFSVAITYTKDSITGNTCANINSYDIFNAGTLTGCSFVGNTFSGAGTSLGTWGANTVIQSNPGYNPKGHISSPFWTGVGHRLITETGGNSTTITNSTTFTVAWSPKLIVFSQTATDTAGETTTIKIDGTAVPSINGVALAAGFTFAILLYPGETYSVTWHTGDASWLVSSE